MQITHEKVPGAHDLTLDLAVYGDALTRPASEPALLFLHGFGHGACVWRDFATPLAERYRTFALNARGHAAIRFGSFNPGRISRLLLAEASCEVPGNNRRESGQASMEQERSFESVDAYAEHLRASYPKLATDVVHQLATDWLRRRDDGRYELDLDPTFLRPKQASDASLRKDFDRNKWVRLESDKLWGYLADITCPTLVLRGGASKMVAADAVERMVGEVLADGRALTIEGAGHSLMLDEPAPFRKALMEFFA